MLSFAISAASLKLSALPTASSATAAFMATTLYRERSGLGGALCSPPTPDKTARMILGAVFYRFGYQMIAATLWQTEVSGTSAATFQDIGRYLIHQSVILDVHLVGTRFGMDHQRVVGAEQLERFGNLLGGGAVGDAQHLTRRAGGIG